MWGILHGAQGGHGLLTLSRKLVVGGRGVEVEVAAVGPHALDPMCRHSKQATGVHAAPCPPSWHG